LNRWCKSNRDKLLTRGSTLEFQIHKMQFVQLLTLGAVTTNNDNNYTNFDQQQQQLQQGKQIQQSSNNVKTAIAYAKSNFSQFSERNMDEIRYLMGAILYVNKLATSPYKDLLNQDIWEKISDMFNK